MARALNLRVVAEGVERKEQKLVLSEMGRDYLQGFLFPRPVGHVPRLVGGTIHFSGTSVKPVCRVLAHAQCPILSLHGAVAAQALHQHEALAAHT